MRTAQRSEKTVLKTINVEPRNHLNKRPARLGS